MHDLAEAYRILCCKRVEADYNGRGPCLSTPVSAVFAVNLPLCIDRPAILKYHGSDGMLW